MICLYPVVKPLLVWKDGSEGNRMPFPASENRLLPRDAIPGPRVNAICFLISPESELPLCLVSIYTWFAAMPDSAWHRLWSIFFLSCAIPGLCFRSPPNTIIRITIPCCLPEAILLRFATDLHWCSCVCWIQLRKKRQLVPPSKMLLQFKIVWFKESGFTVSFCVWIPVLSEMAVSEVRFINKATRDP